MTPHKPKAGRTHREHPGDRDHENLARARKISRLFAALLKHGVPWRTVDGFSLDDWAKVANVAGANPPSRESVDELLKILHSIEEPS